MRDCCDDGAADVRRHDNPPDLRPRDRARDRYVLLQCQMRRDCMLISDVRSEYSMQPRGVGITDGQGNTIDANVPTIIRRLPSTGVIADGLPSQIVIKEQLIPLSKDLRSFW